ncbi:MAG: SMP-30/gluconolactonase/LRE family protein [Candidatus Latescibacterota bacterium]
MPFYFEAQETVPAGVRRIAGEQLEQAIRSLRGECASGEDGVHEARKSLKRLRALVRLVRAELGDSWYRQENAAYRDAALQLGGMRDAAALVETLDTLLQAAGRGVRRSRFATVRRWLVERRDGAHPQLSASGAGLAPAVAALEQARQRVADWPLGQDGWKGMEAGVRRVYARGRRAFALAGAQPTDEAFHLWRRWAKYLWYHTQLLEPTWPPVMGKQAGELDRLGDLLGSEHDLTVLRQTVQRELTRPVRATTLQALLELIAARQQELREAAFRLGRRAYVERPGAFARRLRGYWEAWHEECRPAPPTVSRPAVAARPELIADYRCQVGEGPLWHAQERRLYWVDIPAGRLFRYDPASGQHEACHQGEPIGGFTVQEDGALLLFMARGAVAVWREGVLTPVIHELPDERQTRFNDVIADPEGRVFCGTMPAGDRSARLYRLDRDGSIRVVLDDVGLANGLGFTPDLTCLYFTDTGRKVIYRLDYDRASGEVCNRRVFIDASAAEGVPDGLTVDAQGGIWSAMWGGSCVVRYTPDGRQERRVALPARQVSCPAFGGEAYADLYVTTAGGQDKRSQGPGAGALFRLRPGVCGVPEFRSRVGL